MIKNMWGSSAERQLRLNIRTNFIQNQNIGVFPAMVKTNIDISFDSTEIISQTNS